LDAPGGVFEWAGIKRASTKFCVTIDVDFRARCYGAFNATWIDRQLIIQKKACVIYNALGRVIGIAFDGNTYDPYALEANPEDVFEYEW